MREVVTDLNEQERRKVVFLFSPSISITNISNILSMVYQTQIDKMSIERFVYEFSFDLEYFETTGLGRSIVVKLSEVSHKNVEY